jgi:hypothetical protein
MLVLAIVIAALLLPAVAQAKVTCEEPQRPAGHTPLFGVPDAPVVGREYRLSAIPLPDRGVNPAPHLAAEYCGVARRPVAGAGGWFRAREGGRYTLVLRFDRPGPWALSFMDRRGVFHPLGFRQVRGAGERQPALPPQQWLGQLLWIFQPGAVLERQAHLRLAPVYPALAGVSSPRSTGRFPARARTSGW